MSKTTPSLAYQRRHLLPRWPSDRVVVALIVLGAVAVLALHVDLIIGLVPGAIAATWQKVNGHLQAWRGGGVERAFVMESSAISFYVLIAALLAVGLLQAVHVVPHFNDFWWADIALFIDTTTRGAREKRFV